MRNRDANAQQVWRQADGHTVPFVTFGRRGGQSEGQREEARLPREQSRPACCIGNLRSRPGDAVGSVDVAGNPVVEYQCDAWTLAGRFFVKKY